MCDLCSPPEPIVPEVPPIQRIAPPKESYFTGVREKPKACVEIQKDPIKHGVDEDVIELRKRKSEVMQKMASLRDSIKKLPKDISEPMRLELIQLGKEDQNLAEALRKKKPWRGHDFVGCFYGSARVLLTAELFERISEHAQIEMKRRMALKEKEV